MRNRAGTRAIWETVLRMALVGRSLGWAQSRAELVSVGSAGSGSPVAHGRSSERDKTTQMSPQSSRRPTMRHPTSHKIQPTQPTCLEWGRWRTGSFQCEIPDTCRSADGRFSGGDRVFSSVSRDEKAPASPTSDSRSRNPSSTVSQPDRPNDQYPATREASRQRRNAAGRSSPCAARDRHGRVVRALDEQDRRESRHP